MWFCLLSIDKRRTCLGRCNSGARSFWWVFLSDPIMGLKNRNWFGDWIVFLSYLHWWVKEYEMVDATLELDNFIDTSVQILGIQSLVLIVRIDSASKLNWVLARFYHVFPCCNVLFQSEGERMCLGRYNFGHRWFFGHNEDWFWDQNETDS